MENKTKIGLLFGSFNPIHIGHLFMAEMAIESGSVDVVWFVISPNSPYKMDKGVLASPTDRLAMVVNAIRYNYKFLADTTEFGLEGPSYTYITLEKLKEKHPEYEFHLICGTDVYVDIPSWHGGKEVIEYCNFLVYPRNTTSNYTPEEMAHKTRFLNGVPSLEISSTFLREQIKNNKTTKHLLPESVQHYIRENNLYK
jgi:nicotinate-nucleotide adenylyltransferase